MAGRGPAPKPASQRARTNSDPMGVRVVKAEPVPAPDLPETMPGGDPWPVETVTWWEHWRNDPLAAEFRTSDWDELLTAALLHGRVWSGEVKYAAELRLRVAKFGATQEDRARLRITYAHADEADDKVARRRAATDQPVKSRYQGLRAVD